jgi:hypothetical protein
MVMLFPAAYLLFRSVFTTIERAKMVRAGRILFTDHDKQTVVSLLFGHIIVFC